MRRENCVVIRVEWLNYGFCKEDGIGVYGLKMLACKVVIRR